MNTDECDGALANGMMWRLMNDYRIAPPDMKRQMTEQCVAAISAGCKTMRGVVRYVQNRVLNRAQMPSGPAALDDVMKSNNSQKFG